MGEVSLKFQPNLSPGYLKSTASNHKCVHSLVAYTPKTWIETSTFHLSHKHLVLYLNCSGILIATSDSSCGLENYDFDPE